jgi:glycerol kinase
LSPVISWQDRRAAAWLAGFAPHESDVHARTGLRLSPHYGASKLRWCLDHLPAVQHAQQAGNLVCGPLASFLIQSLVAQRPAYADPANASRSLLWNLDTGQWDPVLLARFGIPATILPQCVPSRFAFGELLLDAAQALPLRVVTGDQSAAAFGAGIPPADIVQVNVGTGAFLQHISPQPRRHDRLLTSVVHREPSRALYALEGTVNGAGSALSWFAQQEALTDWQARAAHWLGTREPIPLFINGIGGIGSPYWAPHVASRFVGEGTQAGRFCAVVESIAFLIVENLHAFRDAGILPRELWLSGGLGQLTGLCHRLADLAGIAVRRSTVTEATGRGLAQWLSDFSLPRLSEGELFIPRSNPELLARYHRWHQAMSGACAAAPAAKL